MANCAVRFRAFHNADIGRIKNTRIMVKVYFETNGHSAQVAVFDEEFLFELCLPVMEKYAGELGVVLTEAVNDEILNVL